MQVSFEIPAKSLEFIQARTDAIINGDKLIVAHKESSANVNYEFIANIRKGQDKAMNEIGIIMAQAYVLAEKTRAN
jgi:hypothetical protein